MQTNMLISNGEVCSYGVDDSNPRDTTRAELDQDRSCPASFDGLQRGSAHAPGPTD
jgi:phospholipid/cholesterol/gamma-HCH transport system substrate-binding protein